ncbi:hypothetical protein [Tumebacillus flagellatus]|uniref:Uncharacterized protein n=1 Tax=Tumebacillus flagellatus TaxID=1157490 RepID=A0A074LM77_9BACL|nr:hypothetical protein [Tumebacillus flagellatus]KEO81610.1 hypothetical protein EL26_19740 [Tumebacillus flagellatus]
MVEAEQAGFPGYGTGFPFAGRVGGPAGFAVGFGWGGWAIAFLVLFFIGIVFWNVWGAVGPFFAGGTGGRGFFW